MEGLTDHNRREPMIRHGGMMRCCIKSLLDFASEDPYPGETHACNWCANPMVFSEGAWEVAWDVDESHKP